jgi:sulfur relay (sulfurtransferase) DsrF/TusC family protein
MACHVAAIFFGKEGAIVQAAKGKRPDRVLTLSIIHYFKLLPVFLKEI